MMITIHKKPCELYTVMADDKIPDNCRYPLAILQAAQNYVKVIRFM